MRPPESPARLILFAALAGGCTAGQPPARPQDLRGPLLVHAVPRPGFVLQRDDRTPFDFRAETAGRLTFLFFGYTNCPDVCPLHLANLAFALRQLPADARARVRVVFVTTDPERDTPERLRSWLAQFDSSFVGVTGSAAAIGVALGSLGMPPAVREGELPNGGGYGMTHGAQLWAFTPDDSAHVIYPWGVKREDLASDVSKLARIWPGR